MRAPKRPLFLFQGNTQFYSCTQTAIRFLRRNEKFWKLYPNGHFFITKHKIFKNTTKRLFIFLQRNTEFWIFYPNGHLYFPQGNKKSNYKSTNLVLFLKTGKKKLKIRFRDTLFRFFTIKNEIRNIIELWNTHYSQKGL